MKGTHPCLTSGVALLKVKSQGQHWWRVCIEYVCMCASANVCVCSCVLLSSIVVSGDKGHLGDGGWHCFLPDLDLDGCSILGKRGIHITHCNILLQTGWRAAARHLTWVKEQRMVIRIEKRPCWLWMIQCYYLYICCGKTKLKPLYCPDSVFQIYLLSYTLSCLLC